MDDPVRKARDGEDEAAVVRGGGQTDPAHPAHANEPEFGLGELRQLMARLREPESGCPWDLRQTHQSVSAYAVEEAYEVVEAIDREDWSNLRGELGDLLFQVVFHAQLAEESGRFDLDAVIHDVTAKLLRRHPHVFPDGTLGSRRDPGQAISESTVKSRWQEIKAAERGHTQPGSVLDRVGAGRPPLERARALQEIAAAHGFDWQSLAPVLDKLREELAELEAEIDVAGLSAQRQAGSGTTRRPDIDSAQQQRLEEEMGDLLFVCVNLARHLGIDSDRALRATCRKFEFRFGYIERALQDAGKTLDQASLEEMENLWIKAKAHK